MKQILVATDFSQTAKNALDFAAGMASDKGASITLVHAYYVPQVQNENVIVRSPSMDISTNSHSDLLEAESSRIQASHPTLKIDCKVFQGDIFDALYEANAQNEVDLTIMGTSGENKSGLLWGSKSMKAMRELNGPILIIPNAATYKAPEHILLSVDLQNINSSFPYESIQSWVTQLGSTLDVVNIQPLDAFADENTKTDIPNFDNIPHKFHNIEDVNVGAGVAYYLQNNPTDWIIVSPKKYNFFENLFHKSKSEMITQASNIPVLAIHEK